jgi:NitT/TauT family transport system substrate-binding protein
MTFRSRRKNSVAKFDHRFDNRDEAVRFAFVSRQDSECERSGADTRPRRTTKVPASQVPAVPAELTTLTVVFSDRSLDNRGPVMSVQTRHNNFESLFDFAGTAIRTIVFPVLAAIMIALWQPGTATAQETVVRVGHFPNVTHVQALVARNFERLNKSWFAPRLGQNVKVEWYVYNAGPSAMEAIFTNAIDMTYVGPSPALNAYFRSRGEEVRIVAGAVNGGSALVVQPDSGLKTAADFRGKKIATPQFGNTQDVAARAWLVAGGLKITQTGGDAQVIPTQNPDQLGLFQRKQLDAVWTVEPWVTRLEREAGGRILVDEKTAVTTVLASSAKFLKEKRELAGRFVTAHRELTDWIQKNPDQARRMMTDELSAIVRSELSPETLARAWSRMVIKSDVSVDEFTGWLSDAQKVGFIKNPPDLGRFVERMAP